MKNSVHENNKSRIEFTFRSVVVVEFRFHAENGKELLVTCPAELNMCPIQRYSKIYFGLSVNYGE